MGTLEDLNDAVRAAQAATVDLLNVLAAHGLSTATIAIPPPSEWPDPVRSAFLIWQESIAAVTRELSRHDGIESSDRDNDSRTVQALILALGFA